MSRTIKHVYGCPSDRLNDGTYCNYRAIVGERTAWPPDRTTTLTAALFEKDRAAAGVAACRDCHARDKEKPKLIDKIPEIKHEASAALITMTNMQAFHRTCAGCHAEVRKTTPASKGPIQTQCMMCHKKTKA